MNPSSPSPSSPSTSSKRSVRGRGSYQFHESPIEDDEQYFAATNFLTTVGMYEDRLICFGDKSTGKTSPNIEQYQYHLHEEDDDYIRAEVKKGSEGMGK